MIRKIFFYIFLISFSFSVQASSKIAFININLIIEKSNSGIQITERIEGSNVVIVGNYSTDTVSTGVCKGDVGSINGRGVHRLIESDRDVTGNRDTDCTAGGRR